MMKRLLTFVVLCLAGIGAFAQWAEPELPTNYATSLTLGHKYQLQIYGQPDQFIGLGAASGHSTEITLLVTRDDAVTFLIDYSDDDYGTGYTLQDASTGLYANVAESARNYDRLGWGMLRVNVGDGGSYYYHFDIENNGDGTFSIYTPYYDSTDASGNDVTYSGYWGNVWDDDEFPNVVWAMLDKSNSDIFCNWQLIDMTVYEARCELYEILLKSTEYPELDHSIIDAATAVYNDENATVEELENQMNRVNAAIISYTLGDASPDNPADATSLINNPSFDEDYDGWDCNYVSGVNAYYIEYYSVDDGDDYMFYNYDYTYVNHLGQTVYPNLVGYLDIWAYESVYGSTSVPSSLGNGYLSQTIRGLPAGTWMLNADVMAAQDYYDDYTVTGVQLFATCDSWDMYREVSTESYYPGHFSLTFSSDGGTVTLGLRTVNTDANWIGVDNFELYYYGDDGTSPYYLSLQVAIEEAEKYYTADNIDDVIAGIDEKEAYIVALDAAKATLENTSASDEEYQSATDTLNSALSALQTSVANYATIGTLIDYINDVVDQAYENGWEGLVDILSEMRDEIESGYNEGTLTNEQITSAEDNVTDVIAEYISENVKAGDDITLVIKNHSFDTDVSGWTVVSGTTPTFGGTGSTGGGSNSLSGGIQPSEIGSGDAEVWHATFDICQTIKSLPAGLYTLSCNAFARDDNNDGIQAELYASLNGYEQTQTLVSITSEGSPEMLYQDSNGSVSDYTVTLDNGNVAYAPNGMAGANIYFYLGYYENTFNVLIEERADLTIGLRETNTDDWVIFDNFRLVYQGNDASAYVDAIQQLIEEALAVQESGMMSNEAFDNLDAAVEQGWDAIDGSDQDACVAAVTALRAAIEAGEESIELIEELDYLVTYTNSVRLGELTSTITDELMEVLEEVTKALGGDGFETDEEVRGYMASVNGTFNKCAMYDHLDATEESPADVSVIILTRNCVDENGDNSHYGWTPSNESIITGERHGLMEIYDIEAGASIEQVLYNLYAGWYRLGVQAFYRPGSSYSTTCPIEMTEEENDTIHYADLYAGSTATRVVSIFSDAATYSALEGSTTPTTYTIPNTMTESGYAFDDGLYHNYLQFQVTADGTDVPIGLRKTGYVSGDWLIWSYWTMEYLGTTEPESDSTTAIESVEGSADVLATTIYSVNGVQQSRLTKGVNIMKTTLSDGTVKVTKVLVK